MNNENILLQRSELSSQMTLGDGPGNNLRDEADDVPIAKVNTLERLHHMTWAWYTMTMSTGGIALLIQNTPHRFKGLDIIGRIVFILDLTLFTLITTAITLRFIIFQGSFSRSLRHPTEGLFIPCAMLSVATLISGIHDYGTPYAGEWLTKIIRIFFWIYSAMSLVTAIAQYLFLFSGRKHLTTLSMTPSWILPVFPAMLSGTIASIITSNQPVEEVLPILIAGLSCQGLGLFVSVFMYGIYLDKLMTSGLPAAAMRPGMFIAVGPPSFTALALIGLSKATPKIFPSYSIISGISNPELIPDILQIVALAFAIFLWMLAFWFFSISVVAVVRGAIYKGMGFHLTWYCFVFPNVGFTIALIEIGKSLQSEGILWVGSIMTALLVVIWLAVTICHARAVWQRKILWPGRDEDRDS
jgi:C4-dicarboxylate transporter/malic acid transport protein